MYSLLRDSACFETAQKSTGRLAGEGALFLEFLFLSQGVAPKRFSIPGYGRAACAGRQCFALQIRQGPAVCEEKVLHSAPGTFLCPLQYNLDTAIFAHKTVPFLAETFHLCPVLCGTPSFWQNQLKTQPALDAVTAPHRK